MVGMAEHGYATLPRGMRIPNLPSSNGHHLPNGHAGSSTPQHVPIVSLNNNHLHNGSNSSVPNGHPGGRAVHDGFATIRAGGSKRGRARSSPSMVGETRNNNHQCHHGCCPTNGRTWAMEPLWEEKCSLEPSGAPQVTRRERQQLPWWEIATRRSRYRSCPAFSQASVVNALEQTMSNVTNRLERLASSPDLKEAEAAELRKTAAVLRQQSSVVCQSVSSGCLTMERQLSCDSVSSVTSSVSGASISSSFASVASRSLPGTLSHHYHNQYHHHNDNGNHPENTKIKKRSWLRSSFRRAFGRHGRKRSKQNDINSEDSRELPMHHTVNSAVKNISPPPPPPSAYCTLMKQSSFRSILNKDPSKHSHEHKSKYSHRSNAKDESDLVAQLRQELAEKERELTDCRLEVLSAQHQLQSQADTITKLQAEVTGLREENKLLTSERGQGTPNTDALLTPLSQTLTALTLNSGNSSGKNLSLVSGRQVKVMVVRQPDLTSVKNAAVISVKPSHLTHIGNINVESKTTWEEFDKLIANTIKDYGNRIDPVSALGLDNDSIMCYRVDDIVRAPNLPLPELLPYGYCVGCVDALHVWLKGGNHKKDGDTMGNVSLAAFSSVTPASSLSCLAAQLIQHRRLLLAGPPASGKSFLAQSLAQFFTTNSGSQYCNESIKIFKVTGSNTLELCQLLSSMWPRGLASSSHSTSSMSSNLSVSSSSSMSSSITSPEENILIHPSVIVIDDLHTANGVVETLQRCLPTSVHIGPAIIATSCHTSALATRLQINCNFKCETLNIQQEPIRGLLGRVLRQRVVSAEVAANARLPDAHHLAEWLTRLWLHLNTLLSGHCSSHEVAVGPGLLMDSPLGQEETQVWFTDVWNTRIVPHIKETLRSSSTSNSSIFDVWTDPLDWVLATYPWPVNAACGPDQLTRITANDIGKKDSNIYNRNLSSHQSFVAPSIRQQIQRAESIYSAPQLLSYGSLARGGAHGTGQTIFTNKDIKMVNHYQSPIIHVNGNISNMETENVGEKNRALIPQEDNVIESTVMNGIEETDCNTKNGDEKEIDVRMTTENTIYKSCIVENQSSDINIHSSIPSAKTSNRNEIDDSTFVKEEMENEKTQTKNNEGYINSSTVMDCKDNTLESKSQPLDSNTNAYDILVKNTFNTNGPSNECVKIIREPSSKIDMQGIANELTSTFKPSETAM